MYKTLLASAAILAAAPAFAGGTAPAPAPAPAPVIVTPTSVGVDWSGPYIGLQYDMIDGSAVVGGGFDGDAFGLFGGYRHDFGRFVLGGEIDYMVGSLDFAVPPFNVDVDGLLRVGIEAGYDAGRTLIYGTLGYVDLDLNIGGISIGDDGFFYGIGIDYLVTDNITLGAEILRHEFSNFAGVAGSNLDVTTFGINIAYRF
ncbi:outer membrane protein [Roseicyclus mahoneyensis]|jgi:outer membrane immunogenic protein|uniref:Outer membrane protein with beta-barrel domain n=1 Tax=Roseicyclus mahoneyensis TaxID=164332 RepID=A0A316GIE8_9RHOB|nr:outer membrane beta-barrel protein [Roseicyclus mahoneyensis]PWK59951.1 outer membrane protein with beta-barrel domain [Roseicyclus mahoneyensis]